jgi:hypothetical protein
VSQFLITVDDALRALAEARNPEQLVRLVNTAETLRCYAQRARLGMTAQNKCTELRLRAERKLGQYLAGTPRNSGGRPKPLPLRNGFPTLDISASPGNSRTGHSDWRQFPPRTSTGISGRRLSRSWKSPRGSCCTIPSGDRRRLRTNKGSSAGAIDDVIEVVRNGPRWATIDGPTNCDLVNAYRIRDHLMVASPIQMSSRSRSPCRSSSS